MSKKPEKETSSVEKLKEALFIDKKSGAAKISDSELKKADAFCEPYKKFLNKCKTEREAAAEAARLAQKAGFTEFDVEKKYEPGDRVMVNNRGKAIILAVIGKNGVKNGARIAAAHIDSPRLDLKPNPLYEQNDLALFKTHYYGGIKKYQWSAIPLSLHGRVVKKDGSYVDIVLGEDKDDPQFCVTDLLPHLGGEQMKKPAAKIIEGEDLNILVGSRPFKSDKGSELVKLNILKLLNEKYGITEDDFTSAELEAVPAVKATDIGLDRSMIGAYGHDDRVCAYAALRALLDLEGTPAKTAVCVLADKEEIGSDGVTGMQSAAFDTFMEDLCESQGAAVRVCFEKSFCLSADVTAAYDPNFSDVYEKRNAAYLNYGIGLCKYTGARGKSGASDADAETVAYIRNLFDEAGVIWQIAELGKVDAGGGGTVAMYMANRNITTLDAGVPVLSMHAPFETVSKLDCYETYKGMKAVFQAEK